MQVICQFESACVRTAIQRDAWGINTEDWLGLSRGSLPTGLPLELLLG